MELLEPLTTAIFNLDSVLAFLIIFGLSFFFIAQIIAWMTPPNPRFVNALIPGLGGGALITWIVYSYCPLAPSLMTASISGVYSWNGYIWMISIIFLVFIFIINTLKSWKENRPLEVIQ